MLKYSLSLVVVMSKEMIQNIIIDELDEESINKEITEINDDFFGDHEKMYIRQIKSYPTLTNEERMELLIKYQNEHDKEAFDKLFKSNLRLCLYVAARHARKFNKVTFLDLMQEYSLVLIKAINQYDITKGNAFSTYAVRAMHLQGGRIKYSSDKNVRVSYLINPVYKQYRNLKIEYNKKYKRFPTKEEIIKELDISEEQYKRIIYSENITDQSLNQKIKEEDGKDSDELIDFISEQKNEYDNFDTFIDEQILKKALIDNLSKEEYYIAYYRFISKEPITRETIGNEFSVTREAMRTKEAELSSILRRGLNAFQRKTVKKYSIKELMELNLIPLRLPAITVLHYLKDKLPHLNYEILYNILTENKNNNLEYYLKSYFPITKEELIREIENTVNIKNNLFNNETLENNFREYKEKYTISEIFELDVKPRKKEEQSENNYIKQK